MQRIRKVEGMYVSRLCFRPDPHLTLEPWDDDSAGWDDHVVIYFHGGITVQEKGEERIRLDHDYTKSHRSMLDDLPHYSFIYESRLQQCTAEDDGTLVLEFKNGRIEVPALDYGEAWSMYNNKGFLIVCMPGGGLAIWKEQVSHQSAEKITVTDKLEHPVEFEDFWFLPLRKRVVDYCLIDTTVFGLQFGTAESKADAIFTLHIDGPFRMCDADGTETYLVPPDGVAPALRLPGQMVSKAFGHKDGRLELVFKEGTRVTVGTDEGQQWELIGENSKDSIRVKADPSLEPPIRVD